MECVVGTCVYGWLDGLNIQIMNILLCLCMIFIKFSVISEYFVGVCEECDTLHVFVLVGSHQVQFKLFQNNVLQVNLLL